MAEEESIPFSSHLNELRRRMIWSLLGVFVAFTVVFSFWADDIVRYLREIAVLDRNIADEEYASPDVASQMPYRAEGSHWTVRNTTRTGDSESVAFTRYEVLQAGPNGSTLRRTQLDADEKPIETKEIRHSLLAPAASPFSELPGTEPELPAQTTETISVPAGEFECFKLDLTVNGSRMQTWIAKTGGLVIKQVQTSEGREFESVLMQYELRPYREQIQLTVIATLETFSTTMRVSLYAALVFAYPWVMFQAYLFVAPGLFRHERRFFQFAIPAIFVLFFAGAAFGRYVLMPISIPFLLSFNVEEFGVTTTYSLAQFLSLVFTLTFGLGFVFQIPLVVAPLIRFGLLTPEFFRTKRRYTLLIAVIIGAIISPTGSPIDMVLAGAPVFFLVEGGVWLGRIWKRSVLKAAEKAALAAAARGEKVDPEALAGGLAIDLEQRLKEFSKGGARKFAQELMAGFKESGKDVESIFDDDYADGEKPPVEVKLKSKPPRQSDLKPDQLHDAKFDLETSTAGTPENEQADAQATGARKPAATAAADPHQDYPDRPWDENVNEQTARYIDDRISQRLRQFMDEELQPWMDRIEHELRRRNGDHE